MTDRIIDANRDELIDVRGTRRRGAAAPTTADDRSIGELLRELSNEASTLVRQEIALAKTEMNEKISVFRNSLASMAIGGGLLLAALLLLAAAVNRGLTLLLENVVGLETALWLAPLILAAVAGAAGYAMISSATGRIEREGVTPHETVATLKEDRDLVTRKVKS